MQVDRGRPLARPELPRAARGADTERISLGWDRPRPPLLWPLHPGTAAMAGGPPPELAALLEQTDPDSRERAWSVFLDRYSDLILRAARSFGGDYDAAMDRYEHALDGLRRDDFRRLRAYAVRARSGFESWLVVVVRRMCLDHARARYGRDRHGEARETEERRTLRRRLVDLTGVEVDPELLAGTADRNPERVVRRKELDEALASALSGLPPRDRLLLRLRYEDDLSVREVAEVLDLPSVFHVYRRLKKVLGELRRGLLARGIAGPEP